MSVCRLVGEPARDCGGSAAWLPARVPGGFACSATASTGWRTVVFFPGVSQIRCGLTFCFPVFVLAFLPSGEKMPACAPFNSFLGAFWGG